MRRIGQPRASMSGIPSSAAAARVRKAAVSVVREEAAPAAVIRVGPMRCWVSAPLMKSRASLKKLVAIWRQMVLPRVQARMRVLNWPECFQAMTVPTATGAMAAPRVLGREAFIQSRIVAIRS